ncbi:MAG TPA: EAL domain-containing protein [Candidatus Limnocylindria bacterium]|nr:EAL domain-containing protein [Candidatus Limnocylindria bacterium]
MTATTQPQAEERHTAPLLRRIYGKAAFSPVARFVGLLWLAGFGMWAATLLTIGPLPAPIHLPWPVLAVLFFAAERFVVDLEVRQQTHSFSLSEIALLLALIFAAPSDLLIGQTLGAGLALSLRPGQRPIKFLFNVANFAVCSAVALIVFRLIVGANDPLGLIGWAGAFAATFASDTVGAASVAMVIWLSQRERPNLSSLFGVGTIYTVVAPSIALLSATVLWYQPIASWLLVVLGLMAYVMLRWNGREIRRHRSVSQLHESTRRIQSSFTLDDVARALLTTARDMFDAELAELLLFAADGTTARQVRLAGSAKAEAALDWNEARLDPREGVWARVAAESRGVLVRDAKAARAGEGPIGKLAAGALSVADTKSDDTADRVLDYYRGRGIKSAMVAPLRVEENVVGTLLVANRRGSTSGWAAADLTVLETLANHAGVAIENSRQADELAHQRDELERSSTHDSLTGLANRVLFRQKVSEALASKQPGAVMLLDLDRFKEVNDTLGHHNGDHLLRQVAARLNRLGAARTSVARLGGDEFALLLENTPEVADVSATVDKLLDAFAAAFMVQGVTVHVEASVGISLYPAHGSDADSLMRRADVAMYQAKQGHTRYQIYERQRDPYSEARLALLGDLRRAVERGQLTVVYQPQRTTGSGEIESVEALVRWQHPQRGELPPDEFIGLAERSEVIHALTRHVLERAIEQCAAWAKDGRDVRVAVNLSARNLNDSQLAPDIALMLQEHGVPASRLELEITESSIESDPRGTEELLTTLSAMGVGIAIDDFGTGYSAFSYLQRLPVDEIKVDRSFVMGMEINERKHQIVRSTVQLGHNLGLRVVAEGVESELVERQLIEMGCDIVQGYHIGRPMSADMCGARLRRAPVSRPRALRRSV